MLTVSTRFVTVGWPAIFESMERKEHACDATEPNISQQLRGSGMCSGITSTQLVP